MSNPVPKDILERLGYFHQEVERLFRRLFEDELSPGGIIDEGAFPPVDVAETEDEILVTADLPGTGKQDIELFGAPTFLVIRGVKHASQEKSAYLRVERIYGPFQRIVLLPSAGDTSQVAARYDRGVLEVRMPKVSDRRKIHRQIPIE